MRTGKQVRSRSKAGGTLSNVSTPSHDGESGKQSLLLVSVFGTSSYSPLEQSESGRHSPLVTFRNCSSKSHSGKDVEVLVLVDVEVLVEVEVEVPAVTLVLVELELEVELDTDVLLDVLVLELVEVDVDVVTGSGRNVSACAISTCCEAEKT
jgi:hypothetical protein